MNSIDTDEPNDIRPQVNNITPAQNLTVEQLDLDILPLIYDIIRWYELRFTEKHTKYFVAKDVIFYIN